MPRRKSDTERRRINWANPMNRSPGCPRVSCFRVAARQAFTVEILKRKFTADASLVEARSPSKLGVRSARSENAPYLLFLNPDAVVEQRTARAVAAGRKSGDESPQSRR